MLGGTILSIKKTIFVTFLLLTMVMSGCSVGQTAEEKIYEHLEKTVSLEKGFSDVQKPLVEAEKKEQTLFNEMLGLSMKEFDQIKQMADEAIASAESRQEMIQKEKKSIEEAYEEFKSVKELADSIEEEKIKSSAGELIQTMDDRHTSYQDLNKAYTEALKMDLELYALLKKEDLSIDELKTFTEKLNKQYEDVLKKQDTFNQLTDQYNEQKKDFYKLAGFSTDEKKAS